MKEQNERKFKGIWIPADIWESKGLSLMEKCLLAEVDSLSTKREWCTASNGYLSEILGCTAGHIANMVSSLSGKHLNVVIEGGNKRKMMCIEYTNPSSTDEPPLHQRMNPPSSTDEPYIENSIENSVLLKKEPKSDQPKNTSPKQKEKAKINGAVSLTPAREDFAGFANPDMAMEIWAEWVEYKWEQHKEKYKHKKSEQLMIAKLLQYSGGSIQKARAIIHDAMAKIYKGFFPYEDKMAASAVVPEQKIPEDTYQLTEEMQKRYEAATKWFYEKCHLCAGIRWLSKQEYEKIQNKDSDFIGAMWYAHCVSTEFGKKVQESLLALNQLPRWDKEKWQSVYEWLKKDVSDRIFPRQK